jgi:hypothetical protein
VEQPLGHLKRLTRRHLLSHDRKILSTPQKVWGGASKVPTAMASQKA